jgi:hypothetical protein
VTGELRHVELWVPSLSRAEQGWGWLLGGLGATPLQYWDAGLAARVARAPTPAIWPSATATNERDGHEAELVAEI